MNRDDIIRMAREADSYADKHGPPAWRQPDEFAAFRDEHFAALVAAASASVEREACAKVCERYWSSSLGSHGTAIAIAAAIRARGQA